MNDTPHYALTGKGSYSPASPYKAFALLCCTLLLALLNTHRVEAQVAVKPNMKWGAGFQWYQGSGLTLKSGADSYEKSGQLSGFTLDAEYIFDFNMGVQVKLGRAQGGYTGEFSGQPLILTQTGSNYGIGLRYYIDRYYSSGFVYHVGLEYQSYNMTQKVGRIANTDLTDTTFSTSHAVPALSIGTDYQSKTGAVRAGLSYAFNSTAEVIENGLEHTATIGGMSLFFGFYWFL